MKFMTDQFEYRQAEPEDLPALKRLAVASYGQYQEVLTKENWDKLHAFLENDNSISSLFQQSYTHVCCVKGQLVGMAFLVPSGNPTEIYAADWCQIRMVGVHPAFSGQGIGRKLAEGCIYTAKLMNEKIIALHTSEFMHVARQLYEKLGFVQVREIASRFGKRYWLYTLEL